MKPVQRIVIRTEAFRKSSTSNGLLEHPAECHAVNDAGLYSKTDDSASVLVHHDQHPIRSQGNRFASKQVNAPQAVLHVTNERQPGRTTFRWPRPVISSQDAPDDILINTG